jgi:hypothetical protein
MWKPSKSDDGSDLFSTLKKNRTHLSVGQALTLAALSAAFAAVVTALIAVYCFSSSLPEYYSDGAIAHTTLLRTAGSHVYNVYGERVDGTVEDYESAETVSFEGLPTDPTEAYVLKPSALADRALDDGEVPPNIAWLMSFPNR